MSNDETVVNKKSVRYDSLRLFARLSPVIFLAGLNRQVTVELFAEE